MDTTELLQRRAAQMSLPGLSMLEGAVEQLAAAGSEGRGAVYTRREVVDFILDLTGYTSEKDLAKFRILEPSAGEGDFLLPIVERLLEATRRRPKDTRCVAKLRDCVRAVELHRSSYDKAHRGVQKLLIAAGFSTGHADELASSWLVGGDFLLTEFSGTFTHVVGNPPYVRQELIPDALLSEYRRRYETVYDRADIYVPFLERSLRLLAPGGTLGFICPDRWLKNKYGGPLRRLVARNFNMRVYVDMEGTPAFHSDVVAYPGIFIIANEASGPVRVVRKPEIDSKRLRELANHLTAVGVKKAGGIAEVSSAGFDERPWVLDSSPRIDLIRRLERDFPLLEETGCKVGIGVATGADQVFIGKYDELEVEADRKLPLAMTRDIVSGDVRWRGFGVINPFADDGALVPLAKYPKLARYLDTNGKAIRDRHVSKKNPHNWYRTIDRIYPALASQPKLLIPDIKGHAQVVFEEGQLYPHHNLYFITAQEWDVRALQAVMLSGISWLFVATYSTKMRGGYLRFQAQYLRKIRLPQWKQVPTSLRQSLRKAAKELNVQACNEAIAELYGLSSKEQKILLNANL